MRSIKPTYLLNPLVFSALQAFFKKLGLLVIALFPLFVVAETRESKGYRILDHLPVGSLKENYFFKASQLLDSPCIEKCSSEDLALAVLSSSSKQYKILFPKIKEQDKECLRDLLESLGNFLVKVSFPKFCLKEENKTLASCRNMLKHLKITKKRLSDLMALAYDPTVLTEIGAFCTDCLNYEKETEFSQLQNSLRTLTRLKPCLELEPGEEKRIQTYNVPKANYILKRDTEGNYNIDFPVEFYASWDYNGDAPRDEVPRIYRERVQECLKEANTMMLGPKGEKINFSISKISKCSTQRQSRPTRIAIGSKDYRSHYKKYKADIDCPTVTHEILHLAGLADEYKPTGSGLHVFERLFRCRMAVGNSIMSNLLHWFYAKENNKSLLAPGHFNSLLYGSCMSKNQKYIECSSLAYQLSILDIDSCLAKKTQCEKSNVLGLDKQEEIDQLEKALEHFHLLVINNAPDKIKELEQKQKRRDLNAEEENQIKEELEHQQRLFNETKDRVLEIEERLEMVRSWPDE